MEMASIIFEIMLGYIPEAIFFTLFLIYTKRIKEKRILLFILMLFEYLLLKYFIKFNVWFQLSYTFMTFLILKILYREKTNILDIFAFCASSIILIISSMISYILILFTIKNFYIALILNRILLFGTFILYKNKLNNIYLKIAKLWNRHNYKNKIRSLTVRNIAIIIFNLSFYLINIGMIITIIYGK